MENIFRKGVNIGMRVPAEKKWKFVGEVRRVGVVIFLKREEYIVEFRKT